MANLLTLAVFYICCASIQARINTAEHKNCPPFYSSCQEIYAAERCDGKTPTNGEYTIVYMSKGNRVVRKVYCDMESTSCGPNKGWMRVAELDMTKALSRCPPGLDEGMYGSKRLCGNRGDNTCRSTTFSTFDYPYTEVCGFVAGYQYKTPDAFNGVDATIDSPYVDGISITHGMPRNHIWSYACGVASGLVHAASCPCNEGNPKPIPAFVGNNWYCESGNPTNTAKHVFFPNDVLWDGMKCTLKEVPCCERHYLPYFNRNIEGVSTDPIELRICHNQDFNDEDIPIESYEFYVR